MSRFIGNVSAYAYAVSKGYTGTEEEFAELMASYAEVGQTAVDAAESALNSKTAAQTAATTATNKASEATTAAQTATTKAGEAQTSAQTASTKASEASQSASTASQKATESAQSASHALAYKTDAESAKTASQIAQGFAEQAKADAITAKTDAESARDEAQDIVDGINAKAEQIDNNTAEITELKNDGVAPSAEQLLSKNITADTVPYHFRQTGGNGADREYLDAVVGGTVGWNQLANVTDGKYVSTNAEPTLNTIKLYFRLQNQSTPYIYHETISSAKAVQTIVESTFTGLGEILHNGSQIQQKYAKNMNIVEGHKYLINLNFTSADINTVGGVVVEDIMCIDLTSALGSAIADYLYSLEHATAGTGVALFKQMFPNDYYAYNAGELLSVSGLSEHKTVGFNQWDEDWELGGIAWVNGKPVALTDRIRSKNFCRIIGGATYYCRGTDMAIFFYDASRQFLSFVGKTNNTFDAPSGAEYFKLAFNTSYGTLYKTDICINLSDPTKNGQYKPYKAHSYPLDSTVELRGIPKIVDGKVYYDGDRYLPDGTVERRYGVVDLGTLTWTANSHATLGDYFYASVTSLGVKFEGQFNDTVPSARTNKYVATRRAASVFTDKTFCFDGNVAVGSVTQIQIKDSAYTDAATFKAAMSGVYLVYELATPTTEQATPYRQLQICDPNGTEEFVTTGIVPVGHETHYPDNLRAKIDGLPWDFSSLIAPTEKTTTASRNYTVGSLLIMGNVLYKVTANIANGGTITPNTNVTATTLSEILSALAQ